MKKGLTGLVQDQQQTYFSIDRKLGSGYQQDINDALDELDSFLANLNKLDLVNSLIVRLTELTATSKSHAIKYRIATIFDHHSAALLSLPSKTEIAASLARLIKAGDEPTRIASLKMMKGLIGGGSKDVGVYHLLLAKLSQHGSMSICQKKQAILLLVEMLGTSSHLASLFSKNIMQIQETYSIPLHILLYMLSFCSIDSHHQKKLLRDLLKLCRISQGDFNQQKRQKRQLYYLERVVIKFVSSNYRIIQFYESNELADQLPRIKHIITKIKMLKYPFLSESNSLVREPNPSQSLQNLIEELYTLKTQGKLSKLYSQYQETIYSILDQAIITQQQISKVILLLYFIQDNTTHYDRIIKRQIMAKNLRFSRVIFKQLVVVGCYQSALAMLSDLEVSQLNYLFLRAYLQFKCQKEPKSINDFKQIAEVIHPDLFQIVKGWEIVDNILKLQKDRDYQERKRLQNELQDVCKNIQKGWQEPYIVLRSFLTNQSFDSQIFSKKKCYEILPSSIMNNSSYWFAYLGKQTITAILRFKF